MWYDIVCREYRQTHLEFFLVLRLAAPNKTGTINLPQEPNPTIFIFISTSLYSTERIFRFRSAHENVNDGRGTAMDDDAEHLAEVLRHVQPSPDSSMYQRGDLGKKGNSRLGGTHDIHHTLVCTCARSKIYSNIKHGINHSACDVLRLLF